MKKLFTIDDLMVASVSALGYGYGSTISRLLGWPELACAAASFVLGLVLQEIISRIIFSETVQRDRKKRIITYAVSLLIFIIAHVVSVIWMKTSMLEYLGAQFVSVVGLPILGFAVNLLIRAYRVRKIRRLYGDGSKGYVFDLNKEDVEEANRQNQPILGDYDAGCAVKTRTGVYVGEKYKNTMSYMGIPYAKPPVGELRWKAPEPLPASDAVFEAGYFGASAVQVGHKGSIIQHHRQSEDCLTLNIGVSQEKEESLKPVLVLFHRGDFSCGSSVDPLHYGGDFVDEHPDVVFVTFNYRLGIFGFIDFSEIPGGEACPDSANLGLLDQIAALKWIRENIAAFGGDPDRITVLGFDSGAASVLLLAAGGHAKGLFRKAFLFSGSPFSACVTPESSRALAKDLLKETHTATMEELLQLSTESLKNAAQKLQGNRCAPVCDGKWIPADVERACQEGAASEVEFIIGFPGDETQAFRALLSDRNYGDLISEAVVDLQKDTEGSAADAVREYLKAQAASSSTLEAESKLLEQWNAVCACRSAVKLAAGGSKLHLMYWNEKPLIGNLGSGTVDVAASLLGNSDALQMYGSVMNEDLSETLQGLLLKWMNGNPLQLYPNEIRGVDAVDWAPFPQALIVSDGKLQCGRIDDRITEVGDLLDFVLS